MQSLMVQIQHAFDTMRYMLHSKASMQYAVPAHDMHTESNQVVCDCQQKEVTYRTAQQRQEATTIAGRCPYLEGPRGAWGHPGCQCHSEHHQLAQQNPSC